MTGLKALTLPLDRVPIWVQLFFLGAFSATAHAPLFWVWTLPICFGIAFWQAGKALSALGIIWRIQLFAWGHFSAGMYWLVSPLFVAPQNVPLGLVGAVIGTPFALLGIPGVIAVCFAVPVGLSLYLVLAKNRSIGGWTSLALIALAWACGDWLRSWVLTGLPWNITAYVWGLGVPMMQSAAWFGPFGLSFITAFWALAAVRLLDTPKRWKSTLGLVVAIPALLLVAGTLRLALVSPTDGGEHRVALVQPNASQSLFRDYQTQVDAVEDLVTLSTFADTAPADRPDIVVWSESATGTLLYRDAAVFDQVAGLTADGGPLVITGSTRLTPRGPVATTLSRGNWDASNSLSVVQDGLIAAQHDKAHLVPFGEYMPLRQLLSLPNLSLPGTDFQPGPGIRTLAVRGVAPFSPLICYEAIFPGRVVDRQNRPKWMVNITTDLWFGDTSGPRQHLTSVRFRSVEEGLPTVRVAGSGISAGIDSMGRLITTIGFDTREVKLLTLPGYLPQPTAYASGGHLFVSVIFWLFLLYLLLSIFSLLRRKSLK